MTNAVLSNAKKTGLYNTQVRLARRPQGMPIEGDFSIHKNILPVLAEGKVQVRAHYLSLDPYMRGRMNEGRSYVSPLELGAVICGEAIGEVLESKAP